MIARKFTPGQDIVSASELAGKIIEMATKQQYVLTKDLAEDNKQGFYFDTGYIVALQDVLTMVLVDPKDTSVKNTLSEEGELNLEDLE